MSDLKARYEFERERNQHPEGTDQIALAKALAVKDAEIERLRAGHAEAIADVGHVVDMLRKENERLRAANARWHKIIADEMAENVKLMKLLDVAQRCIDGHGARRISDASAATGATGGNND